jgi:NhaA family Na+:H+ antiporter
MSTKIERKVDSILSPIQAFINDETVASGILFLATVCALLLANSIFAESYFSLIDLPILLAVGDIQLQFPLRYLINDGLMSIFFLVLGLEIKRELLVGELQDSKLAVTVLAAALGGMLAPALIYYVMNVGESAAHGWGIPMATDTAFALGVLMLLGSRIPLGLKAFLVALAIIDDLGAISVIAIFYTESLDVQYLIAATVSLLALMACNIIGLRHISIYLLLGLLLWTSLIASGVHGTVAGVLVAATVPARPKHGRRWFVKSARQIARRLEQRSENAAGRGVLSDPTQHSIVKAAEEMSKSASTPLRRWERSLERPVLLLVLPLFALTNAGIPIDAEIISTAAANPVVWGIVSGLLAGKVLGISLLTWICTRTGIGRLPDGVNLSQIVGVSMLAGMGFTMSIFIANLTFPTAGQLNAAKIAILFASTVAGICGYLWLRYHTKE